jgi:hypothetical protein
METSRPYRQACLEGRGAVRPAPFRPACGLGVGRPEPQTSPGHTARITPVWVSHFSIASVYFSSRSLGRRIASRHQRALEPCFPVSATRADRRLADFKTRTEAEALYRFGRQIPRLWATSPPLPGVSPETRGSCGGVLILSRGDMGRYTAEVACVGAVGYLPTASCGHRMSPGCASDLSPSCDAHSIAPCCPRSASASP